MPPSTSWKQMLHFLKLQVNHFINQAKNTHLWRRSLPFTRCCLFFAINDSGYCFSWQGYIISYELVACPLITYVIRNQKVTTKTKVTILFYRVIAYKISLINCEGQGGDPPWLCIGRTVTNWSSTYDNNDGDTVTIVQQLYRDAYPYVFYSKLPPHSKLGWVRQA